MDEELARLVAVSNRIRQIRPRIAPDDDFRVSLRALLVATAEREGADATVVLPEVAPRPPALARLRPAPARLTGTPGGRARTRGAVIVGVAVGTLALSGMSAASGDAVPGDALYGIKRSTERAQLALANSEISRGQLYLEFAKTRVAEADAVKTDEARFIGVLADMDAETRQGVRLLTSAAVHGHDPVALDMIDRFVKTQRDSVTRLLNETGGHGRVLDSLSLLDEVAERAAALRTSLACGIPGGSDALGALPNTCGSALRQLNGPYPAVPQREGRRSAAGQTVPRQSTQLKGKPRKGKADRPPAADEAPDEAKTPPGQAKKEHTS